MSFYSNSRHSTPERGLPSRPVLSQYHRSGSPSSDGSDRHRSSSSASSRPSSGAFSTNSRPSSAGSGTRTSNNSASNLYHSPSDSSSHGFTDRIPRTRSKLSELPAFRESLRSYSPSARKSGEDILSDLKHQMKRESDTFFNSNPTIPLSAQRGAKVRQQHVCQEI